MANGFNTTLQSAQTRGDWQLSFTPNLATGEVISDFVLTPQGDIALVTGINRLVQMIIIWLLTPQGSNPFDPLYGNPFYHQLGRVAGPDLVDAYLGMLATCEGVFLSHQDQAAQAGQLTQDEMVDHFSDEQVMVVGIGQVVVSFTVYAQSGVSTGVTVPFATGLAAGQAL